MRTPQHARTAGAGAALFAVLAALLAILVLLAPAALGSEPTNSGDNLRDGWYPEQGSLTPQLVSGGTFGQLWSSEVEGSVYAQPLLVNGEVLIATENNKVYALNPNTGAKKWTTSLTGTAWKAADIGCNDLAPNVGVTSTPVVDPSTNTAYMTHKAYASGSSGTVRWYMDAINLETGAEREGFPVQLQGTAQNASGQTFNPTSQLQRPGLLLLNGVVYAGFGSDCDLNTWQGWVFGVSEAGQVKARWVSVPGGNGAGIWQSGAGLFSDGPNSLMVSTGNTGAPSKPAPGNEPPNTFGESIVRLTVQANGELKPTNFFTPFDAQELDAGDADFASGGITGLNGEYFGTASIPHLAVAVGKDGYVYLLNRDELGGFMQGSGGGDKVVQRIGPNGGVWSRPGVWPGNGGWVYIPTASAGNSAGGSSGFLRVYQYGVNGEGKPTLSLQATSSDSWGFGTGAPIITSEGTTSGSALVWSEWMPNGTGEGAQLRAYDPVPVSGKPVLRWSAAIGTGSKFGTPGVGGNKLFVGNREGKVMAFGSPVTPALSGPSTSFGTTTIGQSNEKTITLTANSSLTVTGVSTGNAQFALGATKPVLPASVGSGQTLQVPVKFKPTGSGLQAATLTVETSAGTFSFSLQGTGQPAGPKIEASPVVLSFGGTTVGSKVSAAATFRNVGGAALTIESVAPVAPPFAVSGAPAPGTVLQPGEAVNVEVAFEPTEEGNFGGELTLKTSAGESTVALAGAGGKPGVLKFAPETVEYGNVPVGSTLSKTFTITNTGGTNVTMTKSKPPLGGSFTATSTLSEGTTIAPGETVTETVAFSPTAPGGATGVWALNGTDTSGLHEIKFTGNGTVPAPGPGWSHNGSATITSGVVQTTAAVSNQAGSAFYETPLESKHLVVEFDQTINGGSGADGQTLTFADATKASPTALGEQGGGLGFAGISGIAVGFDTYKNSANPSSNFAGISNGAGTTAGTLNWLATSTTIPALRTATRHVKVETLNGTVSVWVEGTKYLSTAVTLPAKVLVGFTGGTGGSNDIHKAANVTISGEPVAEKPKEEPPAATLKITDAITAPSGSPQAETTLTYSGTCPSSFTTAALANGGSATPTLTGAVQGAACSVAETAPTGTGWKTTASVNGAAPVEIAASAGKVTVPTFTLAAGANTVAFTNTYTAPKEEPPAATLKITNAISAPSGSPQAETTLTYSGSCPSSFTTAALANGGSATPTLTGAVQGAACSVAETAPTGTGWKTTASVNGAAPVEIAASAGKVTVPTFTLAAGANTVAFTNTYTAPKEETGVPTIPDPSAGGWQLNGNALLESTSLVLTAAASNQAGSAFWPTKVDPRNLAYEFTISIGGGTGADGLAFVIADATKSAPTALGEQGGGLGFAGTSGDAVAFDTWQNSVNPSNNFIGISDGAGTTAGTLHWLTTFNPLPSSLRTGTHKIKIETGEGAITVWMDGTKIGSLAVALPASAYVGFAGGTGGSTDRHAISGLTVVGTGAKEEPKPATLKITNAISAPSGSPQAETSLTYSGTCPSSFTTAALANGGSATPTLTGAVAGANCSVAEAAPSGSGWKTTVSIDGGAPVELKEAGSALTAPSFALAAGANTVAFANTYTAPKEEPPAATLKITNAITAPSGSPQAETTLTYSGTCPSSFTTAALANGGSATPTLTGAVQGAACSVAETAPTGTGWKTTASVNGAAPVEIAASAGKVTVPTFTLAAGANTVAFTNTYEPPPATLKITNAISAPSGSPQAETTLTYSGSCPSSFTTAALANGGSATPTLTGAVQGAACSVAETAPTGSGWKTTVSVNGGAAVEIAASAGKVTVPTFALAAGANTVAFTNTYSAPKEETGVPTIPDPSAGGWQLNGNALLESTSLVLTKATANQAGSAFWPTKVDPRNLAYEFTISIGGGTGADGLAFVIGDATRTATAKSLGEQGGGLGFAKITGWAVAFDTYKNSANPSNNFVGISDGAGTTAGTLHWLTTFNVAASLRTGTHKVKVDTAGGAIAVWLDGTKLGNVSVTLPSSAYVGFSGGTGGSTDRHAVTGFTVAAG